MTFLLAVTLTSMLLAAIMSVVAWRISGEERRRSEARVAALAAEIHDGVAEQSVVGRRAEMVMRNEPMRLKSVPATQGPPVTNSINLMPPATQPTATQTRAA